MRYNITILWVSLEPSISENSKPRVHEVMLLFEGSEETQGSEAGVIYQVLKRSNICTLLLARGRARALLCQLPLTFYPCTSTKVNLKPFLQTWSWQRNQYLLHFVRSDVLRLDTNGWSPPEIPPWSCACSSLSVLPPKTRISLEIFIASNDFQTL